MNCSLDKTRKLAKKEGIINNFNELSNDNSDVVGKFYGFVANIKNLAIAKYGEIPEGALKPIYLDGKNVIFNPIFFNWVDRNNEKGSLFQKTQTVSDEGLVASEKTIRDLAARMSDRIGIPVRFISDRSQQYKGKIENNIAYINLAHATLDTPIHEILGHPIIRAIKGKNKGFVVDGDEIKNNKTGETATVKRVNQDYDFELTDGRVVTYEDWNYITKPTYSALYQNLLKELETGRGKEVLDRVKRDYINKNQYNKEDFSIQEDEQFDIDAGKRIKRFTVLNSKNPYAAQEIFKNIEDAQKKIERLAAIQPYTLEEQQEEAIVELLGLMTAEKLDNVKDGKLISLLKRLLKEMKQFVRSLLNQKEVEIDKLPDNMTLGDLSDLLAYSNSKLILPGYEVQYTTPDNQQFKTYQEASNHIAELAKNVKDVDLSSVSLDINKNNNPYNLVPDEPYYTSDSNFLVFVNSDKISHYRDFPEYKNLEKGNYYEYKFIPSKYNYEFVKVTTARVQQLVDNNPGLYIGASNELKNANLDKIGIKNFIDKNKEYEQSKEIIEEWKKVNNIQYNPEEIYSRGQEFSSVVGAYSSFDVNLMMQNLLQHIEDNEKAGGKFAISAYTKPIDKQIGHLEGGGGKIKFKLYPQSEDILWAANTDVYSGSVWDASEKVNKDKKSELLGVSYTKFPALRNINSVQPNLASIVDDLAHHHNELGIVLTGNNFRIEYDEDIPYQTKKIIDANNAILDQKYGKLVKPEIKTKKDLTFEEKRLIKLNKAKVKLSFLHDNKWEIEGFDMEYYESKEEAEEQLFFFKKNLKERISDKEYLDPTFKSSLPIQPTQTNETLKESIEGIKSKFIGTNPDINNNLIDILPTSQIDGQWLKDNNINEEGYMLADYSGILHKTNPLFLKVFTWEKANDVLNKFLEEHRKEYTNQALINTKIAALKEVAKKYPRSLIRSEVKRINTSSSQELYDQFEIDELPFQKISEEKKIEMLYQKSLRIDEKTIEERIKQCE